MGDFKVVQTPDGLNRIYPKAIINAELYGPKAIRNEKGEVIEDRNKALSLYSRIKKPKNIVEKAHLAENCGENDGYRASIYFHKAMQAATAKKVNANLIRSSLKMAKEECETIDKLSIYHYLLAFADQSEGKSKARNKNLKKFLKLSESVFPYDFHQYDFENMNDDVVENAAYRDAAKETLTSQKELPFANAHKGPRMRFNSIYGPGGENTYKAQPIAVLGGNRFESFYGIIYDQPTKYFSVLPSLTYGTESGAYLDVKVRKNLYESYDRRIMYGISAGANQWKKITYSGRTLGNYTYDTSATVEEDGYNYFIANGLTIRPFLPTIGIATEAKILQLTNLDSTKFVATALAFWEWNRDMGIRTGYLNNNLIAEFYVSSIFVGYNFDTEYLISGFGRTF